MKNNLGLIAALEMLRVGMVSFDPGKEERLEPTPSTNPTSLHNRCKCQRIISWNKKYCKACSEKA